MRKLSILILLLPMAAFAQKKPNVNKALRDMQSGDYAEAKQIIDDATTYEKTKDDGKTWYYRGLIYSAIDTTKSPAAKDLKDAAIKTAVASFDKADSLDDKGKGYYIVDTAGNQIKMDDQIKFLKAYYMQTASSYYRDSSDDDKAVEEFAKISMLDPKDPTGNYYAGLIANEAEKFDASIDYLTKALNQGSDSIGIYNTLFLIYSNEKNDNEKALDIVRKGEAAHPDYPNYKKMEIQLLINLGQIEEAKKGLIEEVKKEPDNKVLNFYLGYAYMKTNEEDKAQAEFEKTLSLDPTYYEAEYYLAKMVSESADSIKNVMNSLGISKEDMQRKLTLDNQYVKELQKIRPYWEKCEKLKPDEPEVLDRLYNIYSDLGIEDQVKRIEQRYKDLGLNTQ